MTNKHIYLAGGCFWGTEHFFKQIAGVVETEVGFANGQTVNPTYEQVYTDTTGYAETELMFQDYEHYPEQWYCEGCMGESTFDKIKAYAELSEERREAYEAYLSYWDEGTLEDFEERYEGKYESAEDFAEYLCEECGYFKNLPQWLQCCIDYTAVWRNLDTAGDYTEVDGHIFRN